VQHHALIRKSITIYPPALSPRNNDNYDASSGQAESLGTPQLSVNLVQGSYFTIVPSDVKSDFIPEWYAGNIYDMERAFPRKVPLPSPPSADRPTKYDVFIAGDYEVRYNCTHDWPFEPQSISRSGSSETRALSTVTFLFKNSRSTLQWKRFHKLHFLFANQVKM
jgi:hypothetical protein